MLKVWIAGANGQIGRALNDVLDPMQIETLNTDLDELDITDTDEVINFGSINRPDVIINCTGITDTDECEKNPEHAYRVNALGARNLSIVARKCGENYVKEFTHKHFIIRSNWVYGKGGNNFVNRVLETAEKGQALSVASDQFGSPTSAKDLARMILYLIDTNEYGTYHVTCSGVCNRYEFATEILRLAGKEIELRSVPTEQSDLSSVRPPYAVLDNFILRIIEVYDMPDWKASLKEYMDERAED